MITGLDESYGHQLVAPRTVTVHRHPAWAERCYYLLYAGEDLILNAGLQLYPYDGRRAAFAAAAGPTRQVAVRYAAPFELGEDPDRPDVGGLRIEVERPLHSIRLVLDDPSSALSFDLTYAARFLPVATEPNRIEQDGRLVTEYMNFFQSGRYSGTVVFEGRERTVRDRCGFRDRGWGIRKHEGSPRRGLVVFCGCELEQSALYLLLYETASGKRVYTNGWLIDATGDLEVVTGVEHDLTFSGPLFEHGRMEVAFESGATRRLEMQVRNRLFLSAAGYTADRSLAAPGSNVLDLADPGVVARFAGQTDNGCEFSLDGAPGHGYVETGLGAHARYRPEQPGT